MSESESDSIYTDCGGFQLVLFPSRFFVLDLVIYDRFRRLKRRFCKIREKQTFGPADSWAKQTVNASKSKKAALKASDKSVVYTKELTVAHCAAVVCISVSYFTKFWGFGVERLFGGFVWGFWSFSRFKYIFWRFQLFSTAFRSINLFPAELLGKIPWFKIQAGGFCSSENLEFQTLVCISVSVQVEHRQSDLLEMCCHNRTAACRDGILY